MTLRATIALVAATVAAAAGVLSWQAGAPTGAAPSGPRGETLFLAKGCASCHIGPDTAPTLISGFPDLRRAGAWAGQRREGLSARAYLTQSIVTPGAYRSPVFTGGVGPTTAMPDLGLSDVEVDAVVSSLLAG